LVGSIVLASACGDEDSDNPANNGGKGGTGGDDGGGGSSGRGGSAGDAGSGDTGGTAGTAGTGRGGAGTGGDGGVGNEAGVGNEGGGGTGGTGGMPPEGCTIYDMNRTVEDIPTDSNGDIDFGTADTMMLANDRTWRINGRIYVPTGKTLEIGPCTLVVATPKPNAGSLFVPRGAKLNAIGTADEPVVFSSEDYRYTSPARWGGIVLLGNAPIGGTSGGVGTPERIFEGLADDPRHRYGGTAANDDSGTIQYTRIEYGGDIIVSNKEINGLSMGGVGDGTTIDHVMVKRQGDDCFEWFGGTVNADHLICENAGDDMFDTDEKYIGHLQFLFGRLRTTGTSADPNGFEWDGNQAWTTPFADPADHLVDGGKPAAANATLCGLGASAGVVGHGAVLRRDFDVAGGTLIRNSIITGFDDGYDTRDNVGTNDMPIIGLDHSLFFENGFAGMNVIAPAETGAANDLSFDEIVFFNLASNFNGTTKPAGFNCYSNPPRPFPTAAVAGIAAGDGFKTPAADYVGAFEDADDNWMTGLWVDWSSGD
jgi:hypothetical protein